MRGRRNLYVIMIIIVFLLLPADLLYAGWPELAKLTASDGVAEDKFGISVSVSGDYAIVGAHADDDNGSSSGSAYIFTPNDVNCSNWEQLAKLTASDGAASDNFGYSVSISGDYAIVGAYEEDDNGGGSGAAYIFKRDGTTWSEQAKLGASDGAAGDYFGFSVSISGNYAIIGAPYNDDNGNACGSAYIFKLDGTSWIQQAKFIASDGAAGDYFGYSVSISGDCAIVGAYGDDDTGTDSGSVYIFKISDMPDDPNWYEHAKLTAWDAAAGDCFGYSVSISGDYAIVGAYADDDNGSGSGSAYIFKGNGTSWTEQAKLLASDGAAYEFFGRSVSVSGNNAIVAASHDDDNGTDSGSAYIFKRSDIPGDPNWYQQVKLYPSDGAALDYFGWSVSISGNAAVVGANRDDDNGSDSGSAYVFKDICNVAPVAEAGVGQTVHPGDVVTLDGSASLDPDENYPLTYSWQITSMPEGSIAELWDSNTVSPTFIADMLGDYTVELVVTDSFGLQSAPASVVISTYNTAPVADAGGDQALLELYTTVQLGADLGRQSYDEDGDPITYLWVITTKPEGSAAALDDPTLATPTFEADAYGDYQISLAVTDNFGAVSDADTMTVSFTNVKPTADGGGNQAVIAGDTVFLDGSGSHDDNLDDLTYSWSFVSKPPESIAEITDPTSVQTSFIADQGGTYVVSLVVNDGLLDSDPDNVTVEVVTVHDALVQTLLDLIQVVNELPLNSLKNVNRKKPLTNKINATLNKIDRGFYDEALRKLQRDILRKTNGCAETGEPDRNDWIVVCEGGQDQVYPHIITAIELLENLIY